MLRHHDITKNHEPILPPHLFQHRQEHIAPARVSQLLLPTVAAPGQEVSALGLVIAPQPARHTLSLARAHALQVQIAPGMTVMGISLWE